MMVSPEGTYSFTGMTCSIFLNLVAITAKTGKVRSSGDFPSSASLHLTIRIGHPRPATNDSTRNSRMWGWSSDMQTYRPPNRRTRSTS